MGVADTAKAERDFWWFRGMCQIVFAMLDRLVAPRRISRGLAVESGTGYFSKLVEQRYEFPVVAGIEPPAGMGASRPVQCHGAALPFAGRSFGLVFCLDREQPDFQELARVLEPGGLLAIRVSAIARERPRFTRKMLVTSITGAGLRVLRCTYANSLLLPLALMRFHAASGIMPVSPWLDRALYAPLAFESRIIAKGWNFPAGQTLLAIAEKPAATAGVR